MRPIVKQVLKHWVGSGNQRARFSLFLHIVSNQSDGNILDQNAGSRWLVSVNSGLSKTEYSFVLLSFSKCKFHLVQMCLLENCYFRRLNFPNEIFFFVFSILRHSSSVFNIALVRMKNRLTELNESACVCFSNNTWVNFTRQFRAEIFFWLSINGDDV